MRVSPYAPEKAAGSITRDRGCLYYIPWIPLILMCFIGAAIGVWVHFTQMSYNQTADGIEVLGVSAPDLDRIRAQLIATAVVFLIYLCLALAIAFIRSFVEAAHDATATTGTGSSVYMFLNVFISVQWFLITLWSILVLMGDTAWTGLLYVIKGAINYYITTYSTWPEPTWLPSSGLPCPGQCLNLVPYSFLTSSLDTACICDQVRLTSAYGSFNSAFNNMKAVLISAGVLCIAALCLQINICCAFSHTKREKESLNRLTQKQFIGF